MGGLGIPIGGLSSDDYGREFSFFADGSFTCTNTIPFTDTDEIHQRRLPAPFIGHPGVGLIDGTYLYASTASGNLYTLNANTGAILNEGARVQRGAVRAGR